MSILNRRRYMGGKDGIILIDAALTPTTLDIYMPTDILTYDEVEIDGGYSINASGRNDASVLIGQRIKDSSSREPMKFFNQNSRFRAGRNGSAITGTLWDGIRHTFKIDKDEYTLDDVVITTYDGSDFDVSPFPLTLFNCYNYRGWTNNTTLGQYIYRATIKLNGTTLRNYVPAMENGVYGMYDTISQQMLLPQSGSLTTYVPI